MRLSSLLFSNSNGNGEAPTCAAVRERHDVQGQVLAARHGQQFGRMPLGRSLASRAAARVDDTGQGFHPTAGLARHRRIAQRDCPATALHRRHEAPTATAAPACQVKRPGLISSRQCEVELTEPDRATRLTTGVDRCDGVRVVGRCTASALRIGPKT